MAMGRSSRASVPCQAARWSLHAHAGANANGGGGWRPPDDGGCGEHGVLVLAGVEGVQVPGRARHLHPAHGPSPAQLTSLSLGTWEFWSVKHSTCHSGGNNFTTLIILEYDN